MIYTPAKKASKLGDLLPSLADIVDEEHKMVVTKKSVIEKMKKVQERQLLEEVHIQCMYIKSKIFKWIYIALTKVLCPSQGSREEPRRLKLQKMTEEAEHGRLAAEYEKRKNRRTCKEREEWELEEAQALLQEARSKKKGEKPILAGVR